MQSLITIVKFLLPRNNFFPSIYLSFFDTKKEGHSKVARFYENDDENFKQKNGDLLIS